MTDSEDLKANFPNISEDEETEDENVQEKEVSNFEYLKIIKQTASSVVLEWKYLSDDPEIVFKLVKLKNREEWETICWSRKSSCVIKDLEQNTCYTIKVQAMLANDDKFEAIDSSDILKCSIQVIPSHKTFIRAVQKSQIPLLKSYLEAMPDFLSLTFKSFTCLCIAVCNNDLNVAKFLLDQGADVNLGIPELKRTPLHFAVFHGFLEMADLLVSYKANTRAKDLLGLNVAHHAIDSNIFASVEYCLQNLGVHPESKDDNGYTLLLRAIVCRADLNIVRYLLDQKASQAVRDNSKISVLQHVRILGNPELVEILLNYKPKRSEAKQKMKHNVQKLIMSRQMQKEDVIDDETAEETTSQAVSALETSIAFQ